MIMSHHAPAAATASSQGIQAQVLLHRPGFTLDAQLQLPGHGITVLHGPSGCGKTTLLHAIAGLVRAPHSRITVHGHVWQDGATGQWLAPHQRAIGYVFQDGRLFPHLNVAGNLRYAQDRIASSRTPAQRIALDDVIDLLNLGPLMQRDCHNLSGGERQRVAIARALASSPRLLLLDEPLAALDAARKAEIMPYLDQVQHQLHLPMLMVTHAPDEVIRLASTIALMEQGRITACAPAPALLARLDTPWAHSPHAATVWTGTVEQHDARTHTTSVRSAAGILHAVNDQPLAPGSRVRLHLRARDTSVSWGADHPPAPHHHTSALSTLPATITAWTDAHAGLCTVELQVNGMTLLTHLNQRCVQTQHLTVGANVLVHLHHITLWHEPSTTTSTLA